MLYTKKVAKSILITPVLKKRNTAAEMSGLKNSKRRSTRLANRPKSDLTMEQQATALLMKKCGTLNEDGVPDQTTMAQFTTQFVAPLVDDTVQTTGKCLGCRRKEGSNTFAALAINAEA